MWPVWSLLTMTATATTTITAATSMLTTTILFVCLHNTGFLLPFMSFSIFKECLKKTGATNRERENKTTTTKVKML